MSNELTKLRGATLRDMTGQIGDRKILNTELVDGHLKVLNLTSMSEGYTLWSDIRAQVADGKVRVHRDGALSVSGHIKRSVEDDDAETEARTMVDALKSTMQCRKVSVNKAYAILREQNPTGVLLQDGGQKVTILSRSGLYRLVERDRLGLPLVKGNCQKGNRDARYSEALRQVIRDQATAKYLQEKSRYSIKKLTEDINDEVHAKGLLPDDKNIRREYVSCVIHEDLTPDPEKVRMGPKDAIAGKAVAKHRIRIGTPFQRVEQDAVHLPWWFKNEHGPYTGVYLVHAIDCCLSYPLGWTFVVGSPTSSDSLRCADRIFHSKEEFLHRHGFDASCDLYGTPSLVVFDNGPETKGQRMPQLSRIGIAVLHCKARAAHGKPFIERLNLSLKVYLEHLRGCTRFNNLDGARDPIAMGDDLMTLEEFEKELMKFYFDHWINHELKRFKHDIFIDDHKGNTPALRLKHFRDEGYALPLSPNVQDWRLVQYEKDTCTLSRKTGARIGKFDFAGPNLEYLVNIVGEVKVTVLVDPDDFRRVSVPLGDDFRLVELVNKDVDERTPAYSYKQAHDMLTAVREETNKSSASPPGHLELFNASVPIATTKAPPKKATKAISRETVQTTKMYAAVHKASQSPLADSAKDPKLPDLVATGDVNASAIWAFSDEITCAVTDMSTGKPL